MRILIVDGPGSHPIGSIRALVGALRRRGHRVFPFSGLRDSGAGLVPGGFGSSAADFLRTLHPDAVHVLGGDARFVRPLLGHGIPVLHATVDRRSAADWIIAPSLYALGRVKERRGGLENRLGQLPFALDVPEETYGPGSYVLTVADPEDLQASRWAQELARRLPDLMIRPEGDVRQARMLVSLASRPVAWPLGVAEAMAAGRPVVAGWGGAAQEFVVEGVTGFLSAPGDLTSVAGHIRYFWERPDEAEGLGAQGREAARDQFAAERHVSILLQWYFKSSSSRLAV